MDKAKAFLCSTLGLTEARKLSAGYRKHPWTMTDDDESRRAVVQQIGEQRRGTSIVGSECEPRTASMQAWPNYVLSGFRENQCPTFLEASP